MLRRRSLSVSPGFLWECLTSRIVSPFPAPPHRTQRAAFPHYALLHTSREGLCDLSSRGVFRRSYEISNSVICEQSDSRVHPSPTPSLPAETLAQEAPRLLGLRLDVYPSSQLLGSVLAWALDGEQSAAWINRVLDES